MPTSPGRLAGALIASVAVTVLVVAGVIGLTSKMRPSREVRPTPPCDSVPECVARVNRPVKLAPPRLTKAEACSSAGYLCNNLDRHGVVVVRRWQEGKEHLVVHVPPILWMAPARAQELRDAAIRGILAWNGHPLPIVIDRQGARAADFSVSWQDHLTGANTSIGPERWTKEAGLRFKYLEVPYMRRDGRTFNTGHDIEIEAVKEMGHALGLDWSDSDRDVMHPDNTATHPSFRDLQTVVALYSFPNGTAIFP